MDGFQGTNYDERFDDQYENGQYGNGQYDNEYYENEEHYGNHGNHANNEGEGSGIQGRGGDEGKTPDNDNQFNFNDKANILSSINNYDYGVGGESIAPGQKRNALYQPFANVNGMQGEKGAIPQSSIFSFAPGGGASGGGSDSGNGSGTGQNPQRKKSFSSVI